jgi:poly(ADP-ribose) glycohydrolase ARH3
MAAPAPALQQRFRGAIVGTAVGDALGAPFEGRRRVTADDVARWAADPAPLRWTDDTAMTISVAESLIARGGFDGDDLARRFLARYDAEPWRGYGGGPPRIFAAIRGGARWDEPAAALFEGQGSFGNGAAMRVAPAGLFACDDPDRAACLGRDTALPTHTHELALQGAAVQSSAVARMATARTGALSARGLLADLRAVAPAGEYQRAFDVLDEVEAQRESNGTVDTARVVREVGTGIAAAEAVPAALHAALAHRSSFADAVAYAVTLGGDTDTVAAMTGALVGASVGHDAIPASWRARLEEHDRLVALADDLHQAVGS